MGYAVPGQRGTGIHLRLRARAFVFQESGDKQDKVAYVSVDGGMASDLVKMRVLDQLATKFGEGVFTTENVAISGTHSHSGPGGYLQYVLYQSTSLGYVDETFQSIVNGITQSIIMANDNIVEDATLTISTGTLQDANINRSPTSYLENPQVERDMYPDGDTDKLMTLLKITKKMPGGKEKLLGMVNWFAVHATSMNNTNTLISGDNKGYASYELEKHVNTEMGTKNVLPGMGPFVAAFAASNLGDVSPNTNGAKCIDTGLPCDGTSSTCNGRCENCIAFGPGNFGDMVQSTQIIGHKQAVFAKQLMDDAKEEVVEGTNGVAYQHSFVQMNTLNVTLPGMAEGETVQLCNPAMGYAFAAGTTDGPGMFGFHQHTTTSNPFWNKVTDFLSEPTAEEIACQAPKPILINTADIQRPYEWDPTTVGLQIFKIGNLFIVSVPSEFTTMSGRRARKAIQEIVQPMLPVGQTAHIVISGLTNGYSSYVTTFEEFQAQRYEAASTIYGPNTLSGYIQELSRIANDMVKGVPSASQAPPKDMQSQMIEMMPGVKFDMVPPKAHFGEVITGEDVDTTRPYQPTVMYSAGTETGSAASDDASPLSHVQVTFHAANPRNNQKIQSTFFEVQIAAENRFGWETVRTDGDFDTKFHWSAGYPGKAAFGVLPFSRSQVTWNLNLAQQENALNGGGSLAGTYRICYYGDHKELIGKKHRIVPFTGCSSVFTVVD